MVLTAGWNGVLVSYPGAITKLEKANRALQAVSGRVFPGSSLMASGVRVVMIILLPVMRFSLTGIRMELPTMWGLSLVRMEAGSTLWREIPVMPAKSKVMI